MNTLSEITKRRGIHFAHLNIRSLVDKIYIFRQILRDSGLHVCGISETWIKSELPDGLVHIPRYQLIRLDRQWCNKNSFEIKSGGGVCLHVKDDINCSESELAHENISNCDMEIQWVTLNKDKLRKIVVANIYRPPSGNCEEFCTKLGEMVSRIANEGKNELVLMGDLNIDINDKKNTKTKLLKDFELISGMVQYTKGITRYGIKNSCIDLMFSNSNVI